jgi:hypothetical protein
MRKVYIVTGTSPIKPTNLPDGLTIEETKVEIKEVIETKLSRRFTIKESGVFSGGVHIKLEQTGTVYNPDCVQSALSREEATKLRDVLTEILKDGVRKVLDSEGDYWYEVEHDLFRMGDDLAEAKRKHARDGAEGYAKSVDQIRNAHGVDSITYI